MADEVNTETDTFNQDFTTATRWEVFCARLEEIIHDWKLPFRKQSLSQLPSNALWDTTAWSTKEELVTFDGMELKVTLYTFKASSSDTINDEHEQLSPDTEPKETIADKISQLTIDSKCETFVDLLSLENNWCTIDEKSAVNIHPLIRWYGLRQFIVVATVGGATINEEQRRILLSSIHLAVGETNIDIPIFVQALKFPQHVYSGILQYSAHNYNIQARIK